MARFDQSLGKRAAFDQPDTVQKAIDPHLFFLSFASSAKAWDEPLHGLAAGLSEDVAEEEDLQGNGIRTEPAPRVNRFLGRT